MNPRSAPLLVTALLLSLLSFAWFALHVVLCGRGQTGLLLWLAAVPPILFAGFSTFQGVRGLRQRQPGLMGLSIANSFTGGLGLLFWLVLVPLISMFALPALQEEVQDPQREESCQRIRILVRGIKTFERAHGRAPVKLDELVDKGLVPLQVLYDPRDPLKDAPGYRIVSRRPTDPTAWASTPAVEGRWPDQAGRRLMGYWDEQVRDIEPTVRP